MSARVVFPVAGLHATRKGTAVSRFKGEQAIYESITYTTIYLGDARNRERRKRGSGADNKVKGPEIWLCLIIDQAFYYIFNMLSITEAPRKENIKMWELLSSNKLCSIPTTPIDTDD